MPPPKSPDFATMPDIKNARPAKNQNFGQALRKPGAPLDNNICERALKKAILHRKNAYFYKTANGARFGDLFMSLIHTCELNSVNPFDYLTWTQKHAEAARSCPADWMPWNYQ